MKVKFGKRALDALKPSDRDVFAWDAGDGAVKGLGLRIKPSGTRTYLIQYRTAAGATRRLALGSATVLTPEQARAKAKGELQKVADGADPSTARKEAREIPTLAELADTYLDVHAKMHKKPSSVAEDERLIRRHIKGKKIGRTHLTDLTRASIANWHKAMKDSPYEANRALACLSTILSVAMTELGYERIMPLNPARGVRKFPEKKRTRYLDAAELAALGKALNEAEEAKIIPIAALNCIRFLALTGLRLSEACNLRWSEVDADRGVLRLVDSKTGESLRPLGTAALTILEGIDHEEGDVYVFGGEKPMNVATVNYAWRRVVDVAELVDDNGKKIVLVDEKGKRTIRIHDLRHTTGTFAGRAGLNAFMVRDLLGHKTLAMTGRYVEAGGDPLRAAADAISGTIAGAMAGKSAVVVPLRKVE
ncbi:MAG: tyrosine-type recombinase/integrase [Alphaproteobacteria bacterium]